MFKGTNRFATNLFELDTEVASREEILLAMEKVLYFLPVWNSEQKSCIKRAAFYVIE